MTGNDNTKNKAGAVTGHDAETRAAQHAERAALQRKRSIAIAVSLGLLAVLFYIATLVKMGGGIVGKAGS